MALPWDFTSLVYTFDTSSFDGVRFFRWSGNSRVIGGIVVDEGYVEFFLSPQRVFYPRAPLDQIQFLPQSAGDRERQGPLIWSIASIPGLTYDVLRTIEQSPASRPDRFQVPDGRVYNVIVAGEHAQQSQIAGAFGELADDNQVP